MNSRPDSHTKKNIFLAIIILLGLLLVYSLSEYFTAFLGSVIFYVLFKGWMNKLVHEKKWKKSWAAILIMLVSFFIILLPITFFITMVYNKVVPIASNPNTFMPYVHQLDSTVKHDFNIELLTPKNMEVMQSASAKVLSSVLSEGFNFVSSILMLYFFLYFMLINFNRMEEYLLKILPFKNENIKIFGEELKLHTFSNAVGIPLIALVQGAFAFAVYYIAGVPQAGFWAILTGIASVIPIVGTGIIWVPVCAYVFIIGHTWQGLLVLAWSAIVMGSMDNVIRFVLAKKMADVHPLITVLGIILGLEYLGVTGLIFGPLLISYFVILLRIYYADHHNLPIESEQKEPVLELGIPFVYNKKFGPKENKKE